MNRALQKQNMRRFAARKSGGGFAVGAPLVEAPAGADAFSYVPRVPIYAPVDDCAAAPRYGAIPYAGNPELAQVAMAGGRRRRRAHGRTRRTRRVGGGCGCAGSKLFGGARTRRHRYRGGGVYGYGVDPSVSVGGDGPNVGALVAGTPCDARAGLHVQVAGGLPVYNATTAGFTFRPSDIPLPAGGMFNEVVPVDARMGGARKQSRRRRAHRHGKKHRKTAGRRRR